MSEAVILTRREGAIGVAVLNRPNALNALSREMLCQLADAAEAFDVDDSIHVIVLHGSERAFSAGGDIEWMNQAAPVSWYLDDPLSAWDRLGRIRKPMIAAVRGYALGGGCELALICDIVVAGEGACFGQPEVNIGIIPGAGGTQRLVRAVGKALAMDIILTGRRLTAAEALRAGLISRVVPDERCVPEAMVVAVELAEKRSPVALRVAKEAVNKAFESFLSQGLREERNLFHLLAASEDHVEGTRAFLEKREPHFRGR
jgi:enoyl-CoA hydratase